MAFRLYQEIYGQIAEGVDKTLIGGLDRIATYLKVPLTSAFTLYVVIYGIAILRGQV
jgi:hypothetical protein